MEMTSGNTPRRAPKTIQPADCTRLAMPHWVNSGICRPRASRETTSNAPPISKVLKMMTTISVSGWRFIMIGLGYRCRRKWNPIAR